MQLIRNYYKSFARKFTVVVLCSGKIVTKNLFLGENNMYKKLFLTMVALCLTMAMFIMPAQASGIAVEVDGQPVVFTGQQPVVVNDNILVPVREIFEQLGFEVNWVQLYYGGGRYSERKEFRLENENFRVRLERELHPHSSIVSAIRVDALTQRSSGWPTPSPGELVQMIGESEMISMSSIRDVIRALGMSFGWNDESMTISIYSQHELIGKWEFVSAGGNRTGWELFAPFFFRNNEDIEFSDDGWVGFVNITPQELRRTIL